ncbi:hypothetical protein DVH05_002196 [Phytophthora capsici]|nr:hypothetical protein DVH05_002196 [Phytophthora capsici]
MRRWGFHTVALASGSANGELSAKKELVNRLKADAELSSWARSCSYRVVSRVELEEICQVTYAEELEAKRREEKDTEEETSIEGGTAPVEVEETEEEEITRIAVTPSLLALAFQRLVSQDKQEFIVYQQTDAQVDETGGDTGKRYMGKIGESVQTPARVYLLVDYPTSLSEVDELLRLGEVGSTIRPERLPLLPLIDGVVLLADPLDVAAGRARNPTSPARKSVMKVGGNAPRMSTIETSVFQGSNTVVKAFYEAAQVGGLEWSDFTFTNVDCSTEMSGIKSPAELEQELITTVESIATQKFYFKDWVGSTKFSVIPDNEGDSSALCNAYESVLSGVYPGSVGIGTVLFGIVEAVAMVFPVLTTSVKQYRTSLTNQADPQQLEEFLEYGDLVSCRLANAQLYHELLREEGDSCFIPHGNHRLDDVERAMWRQSDLPGVGNGGRKAMPRVPALSEPERFVRNTELATFYDSPRFNCWMIHLTKQLLEVEEMLGNSWKGKLQPRAFIENLTRTVLPQRISWVLQQNSPNVCSRYYAPTDSLLLATLPITAPGRMQVSSWAAVDNVRHRPAFKCWKREELAPKEYLTPRTEAAARACIPLSSGQLALVGAQTWAMYPADHSVVRLYQTPRGLVWLTVYRNGETFGLRSGTKNLRYGIDRDEPSSEITLQFIASFQDDSVLHISQGRRQLPKKPDKFPTVTMTNSFPNGLIVSACSDGTITQRYASGKSSMASATNEPPDHDASGVRELDKMDKEEKYRVIYGKGSVLRVLRCGRKEVLLASGIVRVVHGCTKHRHSSEKGISHNKDLHPPTLTTLTVDPETNALVERRPSGVIIVTFTSGARVTYHVDGTRMYMNAGSSHVLVKKRGFADVCIDVEVNSTAQCHAAGEPVAVTKGGLRVRSVVNVFDGTSVEISYNTKVTAQVNGRVITRKPNGQVIVSKDSGRVEYRSEGRSGLDSKDDDDRNVTSHNGVYYFDYRLGQFQCCDNEQNQFHVDFNGTEEKPGPLVSVDLAGVVSDAEASRYDVDSIPAKAVINEPIQPHIFVLNGDGTGLEILRPRDIAKYLMDAGPENQVDDMEMESSTRHCHVFLRRLSAGGGDSENRKPPFNDTKLQEEFKRLQVPVATAGKYLPNYFSEIKCMVAYKQFTTVRRIEQIQPLSADELNVMHCGWAKWEQWQQDREAIKECYKVVDPRQPEVIAQELAMQKKVLAAYKATRARKKMARQKVREMKAQSVPQELSPLRMETVQEGEGGEGENEGDSDDEFGDFSSDMSDGDVGDTAEVDDPMELLWSAFSQADDEARGLLSVAQTRLGLVNVLGIGVTTSELTEVLVRFKIAHPFSVSFDVFTDLVAFFRQDDDSPNASETEPEIHIPSLKGISPEQRKDHGTPRGSAAEAIRARQQQVYT